MQKLTLTTCGLILLSILNLEAAGQPTGCSTYVSCPQNVQNGPDNCTHPNDKNKIMIKANRKNGKLEGDFSCLKESGDPFVRVKFKNDEYDGLYEEYVSSLKDWGTATPYKNGKRDGLQVFYSEREINNSVYANGILVEETILDAKTKKQISQKTFFPDGSVKSENKN